MITKSRFNQYRAMWIYVFFDLPTDTKQDVRAANIFRRTLLNDGFTMFQFSIYIRHCSSRENAKVHERRVKLNLPEKGKVGVLTITDKQFGMMKIFNGLKKIPEPQPKMQLELF